jgi:pimeloyl-ACP methyl ester carboxylesterase
MLLVARLGGLSSHVGLYWKLARCDPAIRESFIACKSKVLSRFCREADCFKPETSLKINAINLGFWRGCALTAPAAFLLCSCSIFGLRQHILTMEAHGAIIIRVSPPPTGSAPTYAVAWTEGENQPVQSAGFQRVNPDGFAWFTLRTDRSYGVGAFTDENGNRSYDNGEPGAYLKNVQPLSLGNPNEQHKVLALKLRREHDLPPGTTIAVPQENKDLGGRVDVALGEVVSLDDERFATDAGGTGLWRPLHFLHHNQLGIYFLEPYDPDRVPVLLVYGIGGTPQDLHYFVDHFDRKRYQLWLFHYPSGARLEQVARVMAGSLNILRRRYRFRQCDVVAHSMGGLVARAGSDEAIRDAGVDFIPKFVSISTPWGGHSAAAAGIRKLKKPVPSWIDVAPESEFLEGIYAARLPRGTRHLLIYGSKKGGPFWLKGENDGVVTVKSEIDPRIRDAASSVTYLPYGHVEILERDKTLAEVLRFLDSD